MCYDTGGYTVQEILLSYCNKILEIIDLVNKNEEICNETHTNIENIRNEVVPELVEDIMKELQDSGYFDSLVNVTLIEQLRTELTTLLNQTITAFTTRLDNITKHLNSIEINVLYPPNELEPLIPNNESLETATLNTQRLNNILNYYSSNLVTLYFPKNVYAFIPTIRVKTNIRFKGDSTRNGTIFKDVSEVSNLNPLILFSLSDDDITNSNVNRIWGGEIKNIYFIGNKQNHDCIQMIKTGWEGNIDNIFIEKFGGRALYLQDVYDTVWNRVTIYECGGLINNKPYYALELNQKGNTTNAQHFNNLHIEKCRYILDIQGARHCYFVNSKFEQDCVNNDSINPIHRFGENAREVGFTSCMFVGNHVNEYTNRVPYYIEGTTPTSSGGITTYTSCDFATGDVYGLKMLNTNGRVFKLDNCSVAHLSGYKDSIKLKDKSSITNSTFICRTLSDGTCQSISVGNAIFRDNDLQSSGNKPSTISSVLTTIDNNFTIENNYYSAKFDYKLDNTSKYLGLVSRRKDTIPNFSQGVIKSGKLDIGQNFYSLIKLNPTANVDLTHITNYCNIGEEFIIYNTSPTYKITLKNVYGGFSANTGQIRTKTQNDLILNGDEFAILKWTGSVWFQIN